MRFVLQYDKRAIMKEAHRFFRSGKYGDFGDCLTKAWDNARAYRELAELVGETVRTWYGWVLNGREVIHDMVNVGQIRVWDETTKSGQRVKSYFKFNQTCELGTQEVKA